MAFFTFLFLIAFLVGSSHAANSSLVRKEFSTLRTECIRTLKNPASLKSRNQVARLSRRCESFQKKYPASIYATRALYLSGMLWEGHYRYSKLVSDWNQALRTYSKVIALYPNSWLADDALFRRGVLYLKLGLNRLALTEFQKLQERYPLSDLRQVAKAHIRRLMKQDRKMTSFSKTCASILTFNGFRYWSNNKYARVVMDFSSKVPFHYSVLKGKTKTELLITLDEPFTLHCSKNVVYGKRGEFFRVARLKRKRNSSTISIWFASNAVCKVFPLFSPYRIVVDAIYEARNKGNQSNSPLRHKKGKFLICLDPGHGGKDPGAIGPRGVKEKDVVLKIARVLKKKLIRQYGYKVIMTRNRDVFIPLEQRVAFANSKGADLFVSIHINASRNKRLQGISTFCLSNTSDKKSLRLAARENGVPLSKMSRVEKILNDMLFSEKYNESYKVAHLIHQSLMHNVKSYNARINNLGVRFAPFYVLAGAKMPSILLELDFISNPYVERRLVQSTYINRLANGIAKGIARTKQTIHLARNEF